MGECLSICEREKTNFEEEEESNMKGNMTPGRTKKNKTRIPKFVISSDEEDDDIPITKHVSNTLEQEPIKSENLMNNMEKESKDLLEKIKKAKKNWEYLIDKLIQKRINILREVVKKKNQNESDSDSEEDEKIEDIIKEQNYNKSEEKYNKNINENNISDEEMNTNKRDNEENIDKKEIAHA